MLGCLFVEQTCRCGTSAHMPTYLHTRVPTYARRGARHMGPEDDARVPRLRARLMDKLAQQIAAVPADVEYRWNKLMYGLRMRGVVPSATVLRALDAGAAAALRAATDTPSALRALAYALQEFAALGHRPEATLAAAGAWLAALDWAAHAGCDVTAKASTVALTAWAGSGCMLPPPPPALVGLACAAARMRDIPPHIAQGALNNTAALAHAYIQDAPEAPQRPAEKKKGAKIRWAVDEAGAALDGPGATGGGAGRHEAGAGAGGSDACGRAVSGHVRCATAGPAGASGVGASADGAGAAGGAGGGGRRPPGGQAGGTGFVRKQGPRSAEADLVCAGVRGRLDALIAAALAGVENPRHPGTRAKRVAGDLHRWTASKPVQVSNILGVMRGLGYCLGYKAVCRPSRRLRACGRHDRPITWVLRTLQECVHGLTAALRAAVRAGALAQPPALLPAAGPGGRHRGGRRAPGARAGQRRAGHRVRAAPLAHGWAAAAAARRVRHARRARAGAGRARAARGRAVLEAGGRAVVGARAGAAGCPVGGGPGGARGCGGLGAGARPCGHDDSVRVCRAAGPGWVRGGAGRRVAADARRRAGCLAAC